MYFLHGWQHIYFYSETFECHISMKQHYIRPNDDEMFIPRSCKLTSFNPDRDIHLGVY